MKENLKIGIMLDNQRKIYNKMHLIYAFFVKYTHTCIERKISRV